VPSEIREQAGFNPSDRFLAVPVEDGVIFKKIELDIDSEYEELSQNIQKRFREEDVDEDVVEDAIEWARDQKA
jgi:bifunctional DNA-binding transcriptional regulator/antitoxin component of YhaV-PrlF toxin-antitoxin module